ncbi:MAG TPA: M67 family metallopeptidase [Anaerolineales bacterium]|nr:M67 family metallopeptidase [Anaerolineales bacterium]
MIRPLILKVVHWQTILAHLQNELPNEACGLLGGVNGVVQKVYLMENAAHNPWEYRMHPVAQVRVMLEIEAAGWELSSIFHSHPGGPPVPSAADVAQAYYPESVYLIFAPDERGAWRGRGFRIDEGRVEETPVQVAG